MLDYFNVASCNVVLVVIALFHVALFVPVLFDIALSNVHYLFLQYQ